MTIPTIRRRRNKTARAAAERFGVSIRTVKRLISEPRNWYEKRAEERRAEAFRLRHLGYSWAKVGEAMGCSAEAARSLAARFKQASPAPNGDPNTKDIFARTGT